MLKGDAVLPFPIASLMRRARLARSPKDRHDIAYLGWEVSVRLSVAAHPPLDISELARGSLGHWVAAMQSGNQELEVPALLAAFTLFSEIGTGKKRKPLKVSPRKLLDLLPAYRNKVMGHGSARSEGYYERAGKVLSLALEASWEQGLFLPPTTRLVYVDSIEIDPSGSRVSRIINLTGLVPILENSGRTVDAPENLLPKRIYLRHGKAYHSLHPWLIFHAAEVRERILFFNGLGHSVEFLDYSNGDILRGRDLQFVDPSVVAEIQNMFRVAPAPSPSPSPGSKEEEDGLPRKRVAGFAEPAAGAAAPGRPSSSGTRSPYPRAGRVIASALAAALSAYLAFLTFPRSENLPPVEEEKVLAFTTTAYPVLSEQLKNERINIPLETNGRIKEAWLESPTEQKRVDLLVGDTPDRITDSISIDSIYLRSGGKFLLNLKVLLPGGEEVPARKELLVRQAPPRIQVQPDDERELSPGEGPILVKGRILEPENCRVAIGEQAVAVDASGNFEIPVDFKSQSNCIFPAGDLQNFVLLHPIHVEDLHGNILEKFCHYYFAMDFVSFDVRRINGYPASRGLSESDPLPAFAGQPVTLKCRFQDWSGNRSPRLTLRPITPPDKTEIEARMDLSPTGECTFNMPPAPGLYRLSLKVIPDQNDRSWFLDAESAGTKSPPPLTILSPFEERTIGWNPGEISLPPGPPPVFILWNADSPRVTAACGSVPVGQFQVGKQRCMAFGDFQRMDQQEVLSLSLGERTLNIRGRWSLLAKGKCSVCRGAKEVLCSFCKNGKIGAGNRSDRCQNCLGRARVQCSRCNGLGFQDADIQPDLQDKHLKLAKAFEVFRDARSRLEAATQAKLQAAGLLSGKISRFFSSGDLRTIFLRAENAYWDGQSRFSDENYEEASKSFNYAEEQFSTLISQRLENRERAIQESLDQEKRRLRESFSKVHQTNFLNQLKALETAFPGMSISLSGQRGTGTATVKFSSALLAGTEGLKPDSCLSFLKLARVLLSPDDRSQALVRQVAVPQLGAQWIVLTSESLMVLGKLTDPASVLGRPAPQISTRRSGSLAASILLVAIMALSSTLGFYYLFRRGSRQFDVMS